MNNPSVNDNIGKLIFNPNPLIFNGLAVDVINLICHQPRCDHFDSVTVPVFSSVGKIEKVLIQ